MTTTPSHSPSEDAAAITQLRTLFDAQKQAVRQKPIQTIEQRRAHLGALAGMVMANRKRIQEAIAADFAVHPTQFTDLSEVLALAGQAQYVSEHLATWATDDERFVDPNVFGSGRAMMRYQPKGVVGVISPWNFPFLLSLGPVIDIIGAGNRVIVKPSEYAPASSELLRELVSTTFDTEYLAVVCGGLNLAKEFPTLAWDHLLYTGSAGVGREVAAIAARNLVPVTLELGGKNPVIMHADSVDAATVGYVIGSKLAKNGQTCITPDYCFVPRDQVDDFVEHAVKYVAENIPGYAASSDCVGVISDRHLDRLVTMLEEANNSGARIVPLEPDAQVDRTTRQMPMSLIVDPPEDLRLMREEIFGPILVIKPYDSIDEAIDYVNSGERPLGLYVFTKDQAFAEHVLENTVSGGACVNACAIQGVLPSLGIGGAGASGFGQHRGIEGFREFSNQRGVFMRGEGDLMDAFFPPYAGLAHAVVTAAFDGASQQ